MPAAITWKTEIALLSPSTLPGNPLASQTFVDISQYVSDEAGATIRRGRSDELGEMSAGSLTLTLANKDGRFTPGNPVSPYLSEDLGFGEGPFGADGFGA